MQESEVLALLNDSISRKIIKLRNLIRNRLNTEFSTADIDLTSEMYSVLRCLWEQDGVNQQTISEKTFKEKANLTKLLDNLEKRNYLYRKIDTSDKRNKKIFLSKNGKIIKKKVLAITEKALLDLESKVDSQELEITKKVLDELIRAYS